MSSPINGTVVAFVILGNHLEPFHTTILDTKSHSKATTARDYLAPMIQLWTPSGSCEGLPTQTVTTRTGTLKESPGSPLIVATIPPRITNQEPSTVGNWTPYLIPIPSVQEHTGWS